MVGVWVSYNNSDNADPVVKCCDDSSFPTLAERLAEFRTHQTPFGDLAPASRSASVNFLGQNTRHFPVLTAGSLAVNNITLVCERIERL